MSSLGSEGNLQQTFDDEFLLDSNSKDNYETERIFKDINGKLS